MIVKLHRDEYEASNTCEKCKSTLADFIVNDMHNWHYWHFYCLGCLTIELRKLLENYET